MVIVTVDVMGTDHDIEPVENTAIGKEDNVHT